MARHEGKVVFVAGTAPGDQVEATVEERGRYSEGRLVRVVVPGSDRVAPRCRHVSACGACQWQQVSIEAQHRAKRQSLEEALVRLGGVDRQQLPLIGVVASSDPFRYRRRARFAVSSSGALGYRDARGSNLVLLRECWLLEAPLEQLALALTERLPALSPRPQHVELCWAGQGSALFEYETPVALATLQAVGQQIRAQVPALAGLVLRAGGRSVELGTPALRDGELWLRPDVFAQANRELSRQLVSAAVSALDPQPRDRVLELFAGSGNFTLALAGVAGQVVAIEREGEAVGLLRRALADRRLANVEPRTGDAAQLIEAARRSGEPYDLVLLDPPRAGAADVLAGLAALGPRRIAYVSCDAATLARDVRSLSALGYALRAATVFDQFPQTFHFESLVVFEPQRATPVASPNQ